MPKKEEKRELKKLIASSYLRKTNLLQHSQFSGLVGIQADGFPEDKKTNHQSIRINQNQA